MRTRSKLNKKIQSRALGNQNTLWQRKKVTRNSSARVLRLAFFCFRLEGTGLIAYVNNICQQQYDIEVQKMNNVIHQPKKSEEESIDKVWKDNLDLLEGKRGAKDLDLNDKEIIMSRLVVALTDVEGLPDDLDNPETEDEVEAVNRYADALYDLFSQGADIAASLMVGSQVEQAFDRRQDELGLASSYRDKLSDAGHKETDF